MCPQHYQPTGGHDSSRQPLLTASKQLDAPWVVIIDTQRVRKSEDTPSSDGLIGRRFQAFTAQGQAVASGECELMNSDDANNSLNEVINQALVACKRVLQGSPLAIWLLVDPLSELTVGFPAKLSVEEARLLALSELDNLYWCGAQPPAFCVLQDGVSTGDANDISNSANVMAVPYPWLTSISHGPVPVNVVPRGWLYQQWVVQTGQAVLANHPNRGYRVTPEGYESWSVGLGAVDNTLPVTEVESDHPPLVIQGGVLPASNYPFWQKVLGQSPPAMLPYGSVAAEPTWMDKQCQRLVSCFPLWVGLLVMVSLWGWVLTQRIDNLESGLMLTGQGLRRAPSPLPIEEVALP